MEEELAALRARVEALEREVRLARKSCASIYEELRDFKTWVADRYATKFFVKTEVKKLATVVDYLAIAAVRTDPLNFDMARRYAFTRSIAQDRYAERLRTDDNYAKRVKGDLQSQIRAADRLCDDYGHAFEVFDRVWGEEVEARYPECRGDHTPEFKRFRRRWAFLVGRSPSVFDADEIRRYRRFPWLFRFIYGRIRKDEE